jgi:hypothetical protein
VCLQEETKHSAVQVTWLVHAACKPTTPLLVCCSC